MNKRAGSPTSFDIQPMKFKSRREAKDWCASHYPGSPVTEIGADRSADRWRPRRPFGACKRTRNMDRP